MEYQWSAMKIIFILSSIFFLTDCQPSGKKLPIQLTQSSAGKDSLKTKSYEELLKEIEESRKLFWIKYIHADTPAKKECVDEVKKFWINTITNDLYNEWKNTPWDYNGTTVKPRQGSIACGFFVVTILQDMGLKVNRTNLSVCPSSQMMKSLVPLQQLKNISYLSYSSFNEKLKEYGSGVYIIGLDFHTGFIVNDGKENWFIHSNYIGRAGVTKETVLNSDALKSSKTRWVVSLTDDKDFLQRWMKGWLSFEKKFTAWKAIHAYYNSLKKFWCERCQTVFLHPVQITYPNNRLIS